MIYLYIQHHQIGNQGKFQATIPCHFQTRNFLRHLNNDQLVFVGQSFTKCAMSISDVIEITDESSSAEEPSVIIVSPGREIADVTYDVIVISSDEED